ncbi:uncharacterized protein TNCV_1234371 [Trichonephila clavipes]|nr:uncharacterized protein TNCV_1234371 [Trichonephila clavipes]
MVWMFASNACFALVIDIGITGKKNHPDNINHIISCLQRFAKDAKDLWAFLDEEDEEMVEKTEEAEIEMCECQHFQPNPHDMYGRPKLNNVGFYDSVFEKPDMWEEGIEFNETSGLGKDVYGIIQRYLKNDMTWFHIFVKFDILIYFVGKWKIFGMNLSFCPFGVCAMV